jgi:hypothetical protein
MADDKNLEHHPTDVSDPAARHEPADINVRVIGKFAIGLILAAIASIFLMIGLFRYFEMREDAGKGRPAGVDLNTGKLPPEPRLQDSAVQDLRQIRAAEDKVLNTYGWVDQKKGVVKIPVDRAIDLLTQRGLPKHPVISSTPANGGNTSTPAEAVPASPADQPPAATPVKEGQPK